jgi:hypothetical protein
MPALIDTSAVLAAIDRRDPAQRRVVDGSRGQGSTIHVPVVRLPEIAFLLESRHGASSAASAMDPIGRGRCEVPPA